MSQLRKKIGSLEVMMQQMHLEQEPILEPEEDLEAFLKKMVAEYIQTRKESVPRKRQGF